MQPMFRPSKTTSIVTIIALLGLAVVSWISPSPADDRNLKVLPRDISSDSLERVMDGFVTALGVDCRFCHAPKDSTRPKVLNYASDANPMKETTRIMMRMTIEMNERYMKQITHASQLVTCNTCHRGQPTPEAK